MLPLLPAHVDGDVEDAILAPTAVGIVIVTSEAKFDAVQLVPTLLTATLYVPAAKPVNDVAEAYDPVVPFVIKAYSYVFDTSTLPPEAETENEPVPVEHDGFDDETNVTATAVTLLLLTFKDVVHVLLLASLK
jgi:hypothetical protein